MFPIRLAIISDLHIGEAARSRDLSPHPDCKAAETGFRERFVRFIEREGVTANYLLIAGDISHRADPSEFQLASDFISEIATSIGVPQNKIAFVPGNHDVNWPIMGSAPDPTGFFRRQRYTPLNDENWIFRTILSSATPGMLESPYFSFWDNEDLIIIGYNSSWHDNKDLAIHHGTISTESIQQIDRVLSNIPPNDARIKVFLVHHHPIQYSDPIPEIPEFSIMTNSENLVTTLQRHGFDLFIHGHKHVPRFKTISEDSGNPLIFLGSGSFSSELDSRWSGSVNNQFHLLTIEGRDSNTGCIIGYLQNWSYTCASGWANSQMHNGIIHRMSFGTYLNPRNLNTLLLEMVQIELQERSFVTWTAICSKREEFRYLPPKLISQALDLVSSELGLKRHGSPPDEIILLREEAYGR